MTMSSNKISTITGSVLKFIAEQAGTLDHFKKEREAKTKHHQKDRIRMHDLSARQSRLTPIKTGMTHREEVEMDEASKGNPARPKSKMDIIRTASKDAANRPPGATPSWLKNAVKIKTTKDIGYKVTDVGPGGKEIVRSQHNWKEEVDLDEGNKENKEKKNISVSEEIEHIEEANMDHSSFEKEYRENESNNKHSENVVLMAKHFGSEEDHEKAKDILRRHKRIGHLPQDLATERLKIVKKLWPKASQHMKSHANEEVVLDEGNRENKGKKNSYVASIIQKKLHSSVLPSLKYGRAQLKKEEVDLEEGRGRPPKVGSKAWHAKQAAVKSGEGEEQEADKNIVNQMRKKPVGDHHHLTFNNGEKKQVHVQHVNKALSMLANTHKPADREKLQNSLSHSHDRFMSTVKSGKPIEDAPKPKVSLGKMKAEAIEVRTSPIDVGTITPSTFRDKFGVLRMRNVQKGRKAFKGDIIKDETEINVVELENSLNSLYENLSEENKEIFKQMIVDIDGFNQLVDFAKEQGL